MMPRRQIGFFPKWAFYSLGAFFILLGIVVTGSTQTHLVAIIAGVILIVTGLIKNWLEWRQSGRP